MSDSPTFWIAAGGTGGHIIPGVVSGRALGAECPALRLRYFSGPRAIERTVYTDEGISPTVLRSGVNRTGLGALLRPVEAMIDVANVLALALRERPVGVLAMGGAVCFPVLAVARLLRIPIFLHESNSVPGRLVRLFASTARVVFLGLPAALTAKTLVVGTPARPAEKSLKERQIVIAVGGSQGALALNRAFAEAVALLAPQFPNYRFLLITGPGKQLPPSPPLELLEYTPTLPALLSESIVAVSRAGSGSLADIANQRVPAVLIPYPYAMDDHQRANAERFAEKGAAIVIDEAALTGASLAETLSSLLQSEEKRSAMRAALTEFDSTQSASRIASEIAEALSLKRASLPTQKRLVTDHGQG